MLVDTEWTGDPGGERVTEKLIFVFGVAVIGVRARNKDGTYGLPVKKGGSAVANSANVKDNNLLP